MYPRYLLCIVDVRFQTRAVQTATTMTVFADNSGCLLKRWKTPVVVAVCNFVPITEHGVHKPGVSE